MRIALLACILALASSACGVTHNEDEDLAMACTDLCTTSGFAQGNAEVFPHELNCFCAGGNASAKVSAATCTQTCKDLGWSEGEAFAAHACQCS